MPGLPIAGLLLWMWRWRMRRDQKSKRPFLQMPRPPGWSLQSRTEDQEQIEWHLRIASLLVGLAVGILSLVSMIRKLRRR